LIFVFGDGFDQNVRSYLRGEDDQILDHEIDGSGLGEPEDLALVVMGGDALEEFLQLFSGHCCVIVLGGGAQDFASF
jgi:hypothetical protein